MAMEPTAEKPVKNLPASIQLHASRGGERVQERQHSGRSGSAAAGGQHSCGVRHRQQLPQRDVAAAAASTRPAGRRVPHPLASEPYPYASLPPLPKKR